MSEQTEADVPQEVRDEIDRLVLSFKEKLDELKDWRQLSAALYALPLPEDLRQNKIWPNTWHQDCAAVAFALTQLANERDHWKANHDNQVALKSMLMDRPDLGDRAASIQKLTTRIAELESAVEAQQKLRLAVEDGAVSQSLIDSKVVGVSMANELALRARVAELETRLLDSAEDWAFCGLDPSKVVEPLAKLAEYRTAARIAAGQRDALIAAGSELRRVLMVKPINEDSFTDHERFAAWDAAVRGAPKVTHHQNCDALDTGPDGIIKPCNCKPPEATP